MENILLAAFTAVESAHAFSAFLPSVFTIKTFADTEEKKQKVREGYIYAWIFALALGLIVSALAKSKLPIIFSVVTAAFMTLSYELSLRSST